MNTILILIKKHLDFLRWKPEHAGDRYSVVLFAAEAKVEVWEAPVTTEFVPPSQWTDQRAWGTDFNQAFEKALGVIERSSAPRQFVVFLTDGWGAHDKVAGYLNGAGFLAARRIMKAFDCFCIGYSGQYCHATLKKIAEAANLGALEKFTDHQRIDYLQEADENNLAKIFGEIGSTLTYSQQNLTSQKAAIERCIQALREQCAEEKKR